MKTTLALLLSLAGFSAFAQTSSRPLRFYESIAAMVANRPITNEVLAITQRSGTNAGPLLFFWHAPTAAPTNTVDTFNAPGGGQYRLITNVVTIAIPDGSITTNKWDSVAHQWVSGKLDLSGGTMTGALSNSVSIGSPVIFVGSTNLNTALSAKAPLASPSFTGVVLVNGTNLMSEIAAKQAAFSTSVGITNSGNVLQPVLAGGTNVVLTTNGNAIVINSTASGSGSGNASTNATQGWAAANTNTANGPWIFNGPVTTADLNVSAINFSGVWGFSNGGLGVTNASDARTVLGLVIDTDIQSASTHLLRIARVAWASGDFIWHDGTGLTNFASTSTGRSLLSATDAASGRSTLGTPNIAGDTFTGPVKGPMDAYSSTWTNSVKTNEFVTKGDIATKIEALSIGAYISSVDTNLQVTGSQLKITNFVAGATGPIARKSDLDALSATSTNTTIVDVLTNATGTWSKPAAAKLIRIIAFGGGGGGGGGGKGTNVSVAGGGGGGAGAGMMDWTFHADEIASSVAYTNGIGGSGGSSQTANDSVGIVGTTGGNTLFGGYAFAPGGSGGQGGTNTGTTSATLATTAMYIGGNGAAGGVVTSPAASATVSGRPGGSSGGGAGGAVRPFGGTTLTNIGSASGSVYSAITVSGANGGDTTTHPNGYDGTGWTISQSIVPRGSTGGGGGTSGSSGIGNGGQGGWPGGGGGGGAGSLNASNSGAGGKGGDGVIVVITHR